MRALGALVVVAALIAITLAGLRPAAPAFADHASARPAALTYVHCLTRTGSYYQARSRPSACTHFGPGGTFGRGVNLVGLTWSSWGGAVARGTGRERGFHLPYSNIPATVTAYAPAVGCAGRRVYTRLKATTRYGTTIVPLRRCPGRS